MCYCILLASKVSNSSHQKSSGIITHTYVRKIYSASVDGFLLRFTGEKCCDSIYLILILSKLVVQIHVELRFLLLVFNQIVC